MHKEVKMKTDNLLLFLAVAAVIVSAIGASISYNNPNLGGESWITGFVSDTGTINLSVITSADINFTTDNINFSSGQVMTGFTRAQLITTGLNNTNGTWRNVTQGFILENIGNVNVTLDLASSKTAAQFIGGTSPIYQFNITNSEPASCFMNQTQVSFNNTWYDFNTTSPGTRVCTNFSYIDTLDQIRIDVRLVIPYDSLTGNLGDIVTATAACSTCG